MQRVFVGLSGGVDSAVSAALLKERGYFVEGVFIKIWQPEFIECTWERDRIDAMRVAAALSISFREIDLSQEYRRDVVQEMTRGYAAGFTPNPDVSCNEKVKFGAFAGWAFASGAEMVATGHYAQIQPKNGAYELHRGLDPQKDQSYFLYRMPRECLARTLFPVGNLTKDVVRGLAIKFNLPVATKRDSQGLCFVGDVSMRDFLARFIPISQGVVLNRAGEVIGVHEGAALYTKGQRHGFSVGRSATPHYVCATDIVANTITVTEHKDDCADMQAALDQAHWLADVSLPLRACVQARYRETAVPATIYPDRVVFDTAHIASPGQDLVIFDGTHVLGGSRIV